MDNAAKKRVTSPWKKWRKATAIGYAIYFIHLLIGFAFYYSGLENAFLTGWFIGVGLLFYHFMVGIPLCSTAYYVISHFVFTNN